MEPTKQSALSHRGKPGHHRNAQLFGVIGVDPVLKLQDFGVTVKPGSERKWHTCVARSAAGL